MWDNSLINISGLEGHFMVIDMNIEHLINDIKVCVPYCYYISAV